MNKQKRFVEKANKKYNNFFDYSLVEYKTPYIKVKIICPKHGVFEQTPTSHLSSKTGCPVCGQEFSLKNQKTKTTEQFIEEANKNHNNFYDYSLVDYINNYTKVKIICPKHGVFEQTPYHHLSDAAGCPYCKESHGERKINIYLKNKNIKYFREYKFVNLKDINQLSYDFYLPEKNLLIEYQGEQHYKNSFGEQNLQIQQKHDLLKSEYAKNNNLKLLTIPYWDYKIIEEILEENIG